MDRKPASHLGHVVPIVRKLWIIRPSISSEPRFKSARLRHSFFPEDTRHFPIREWLCSGPGFKTRRILSCVLQEQEAPILRGNLGISRCKLEILKGLGLRGGGNRERTILHRRIPFNNPNLGSNWSLPAIRPVGANECIGDFALTDMLSVCHSKSRARFLACWRAEDVERV